MTILRDVIRFAPKILERSKLGPNSIATTTV